MLSASPWVEGMTLRRWYAIAGDRPDLDLQTVGRFGVASCCAIDLAVLVRHADGPVYAMRLN